MVVLSPRQPTGLSLTVDGQSATLLPAVSLGSGTAEGVGRTTFWSVTVATAPVLAGNAEHVLSLPDSNGVSRELTRFTTAAGYDKVQGTAPVIRGVRLWRVRYPVKDIASGNCVFSEYHGFISVDYDPATLPNTPPDSVIQKFALSPETGGTTQTFFFTGTAPFKGLEPTGEYPLPLGDWHPELDPTRRYCLSIEASGDGDLARGPLQSNPTCVAIKQVSATGAASSGAISQGGGCSAIPGNVQSKSFGAGALLVALWFRGRGARARVSAR